MHFASRAIVLLLSVASILPCLHASARQKEPDYPCYMRTASGRVINLTQTMCSSPKTTSITPIAAAQTTAMPNQRPAIEFAGFRLQVDKYGRGYASGQITNRSQQQIAVQFINFVDAGNIVQVHANAIVKAGATVEVKDALVKGNLTPSTYLNLADAESWATTFNEAQSSGFAACEFVSNVNEAEKHCQYH